MLVKEAPTILLRTKNSSATHLKNKICTSSKLFFLFLFSSSFYLLQKKHAKTPTTVLRGSKLHITKTHKNGSTAQPPQHNLPAENSKKWTAPFDHSTPLVKPKGNPKKKRKTNALLQVSHVLLSSLPSPFPGSHHILYQ